MAGDNLQDGVRQLVKRTGLRWTQLAISTGIRRAKLSEWKNSKAKLTDKELRRVANVIDGRLLELSEAGQLGALAVPAKTSIAARGAAIRRGRLKFGISQGALGEKAGIAQFEVSLIETGASGGMSPSDVTRLEKALEDLKNTRLADIDSDRAKLSALFETERQKQIGILEKYSKGVDKFRVERPDFDEIVGRWDHSLVPPRDLEEHREWIERESRKSAKFVIEHREIWEAVGEIRAQEKHIGALEQQLAGMAEQVAALRAENTSLREWLDQEQVAALEYAKAKELEEKVLTDTDEEQ